MYQKQKIRIVKTKPKREVKIKFALIIMMLLKGLPAPREFPTEIATLSLIPEGIIVMKLMKLEMPIEASRDSTFIQPAYTLMISKHHHSRQITNALGIPYFKYSAISSSPAISIQQTL